MNNNKDRYIRQRLYKNIGKKQELIIKSSVCIIGLGALGSVCSELLARAGIGKLYLFDYENVELTNLQRQFYYERDVGKSKVISLKKRLKNINSNVNVYGYKKRITNQNLELIKKTNSNIVIVCTDDMATRFLLNDFCLKEKKIFITGLVSGSKGYVMKFIDKPCFNCVFKKESCFNCETQGILNSLSVLIGSLMANEAIKSIVNKKDKYTFLSFEIWNNEFQKINVKKFCDLHK